MADFIIGQRWVSEMEPELGLGKVLEVDNRTVKIHFPASGATRQYAAASAPLKRVRYKKGDEVPGPSGDKFIIKSVKENDDGLLVYKGEIGEIIETDLNDAISFDQPEDRLLAAQGDYSQVFELRRKSGQYLNSIRRSPVRGFIGGRIDLIPHQLSIAADVARRALPRVLLADEVGLGKTIEACLILHRLMISGRAGRVLILVPEPLVNQWIVEMYRRFHVWFHHYDAERVDEKLELHPDDNPFLDDQLIIASHDYASGDEKTAELIRTAEWDVLVVDEAHHLQWTPQEAGPSYKLVESLASQTNGLLLLTATPEQLGPESHFARLRLLDPDRYTDLDKYRAETEHYGEIADLVDAIDTGKKPAAAKLKQLKKLADEGSLPSEMVAALSDGSIDEEGRENLIDRLLDLHGVGRVMFRNTRAAMKGFPQRTATIVELETDDKAVLARINKEFMADAPGADEVEIDTFEGDPRLTWLVDYIKSHRKGKALVICRNIQKVLALQENLRTAITAKTALFHEDLPLVQRDRNAAWFAEKDGAQLLICSEIGSEGRNFQFADDLILFDLPGDPELLEQRIGRLDRIGRTTDISVIALSIKHTASEVLTRWYHEGLNALQRSLPGGARIAEKFSPELWKAADAKARGLKTADKQLESVLKDVRAFSDEVSAQLEQGRDRLLERNSFNQAEADFVKTEIEAADADTDFERHFMRVLEFFGVSTDEIADRTYTLKPGSLLTDAFPPIPEDGMAVTFNRARAMAREDETFFSYDHPFVNAVLELMLSSEYGNSSFTLWRDRNARMIMIEAIYMLECVAPAEIDIDRFLPPTPVRVVINQQEEDITFEMEVKEFLIHLTDGPAFRLLNTAHISQMLIPKMFAAARKTAEEHSEPIIEIAIAQMNDMMTVEIDRLESLRALNNIVQEREIELLREQHAKLEKHLQNARVRLDAVRLVWRGPSDHRLLR